MARISSDSLSGLVRKSTAPALIARTDCGNVAMSRDEHDVRVRLSGLALQVESIGVRKFHVQNEASRYVWFRICDVLSSRTERDHVQVEARQQVSQRFANPPVIIHDKDDMVLRHHSREDAPLTGRSPSDAGPDALLRRRFRAVRQTFADRGVCRI